MNDCKPTLAHPSVLLRSVQSSPAPVTLHIVDLRMASPRAEDPSQPTLPHP